MRLSAAGAADWRGSTRWWTTTAAACALALAGLAAFPGAAVAQESPEPEPEPSDSPPALHVPEPVPGEPVCEINDPRLVELSGMVAVGDQYIVVNDSQDFGFEARLPIFFLNQDCEVVDEQPFLIGRPLDPEGLEYDPQTQTLWVGDIGDNAAGVAGGGETRPTVALWRVDLSGGDRTPVIHRFVYPDGQPRDAEALLIDGEGMPMIVTKTAGPAELYVPTELIPNNPPEQGVPLEKVGEFDPPDTGTPNRFQAPGRKTITGGAVAPDGSRVVLRTYADAFEFDVVDGDVAGAITEGEPRVTPLPDEPQGEAITYTSDGSHFLTVSEVGDDGLPAVIARYTPSVPPEPTPPPAEPETPSESSGFSLFNNVQDIINLIAAVGVVGLILVGVGVFGIVRARRRRAAAEDSEAAAPVTGRANLYGSGAAGGGGAPDGSGSPTAPGSPGGPDAAAHEQGWEPGAGRPSGVYTSQAAGEGEYPAGPPAAGQQQPPAGGEYPGGEYGGGQYGGTTYSAHAYPENAHPGNEYPGNEYGGQQQYAGQEYGGQQYAGGQYGGGEYGGHQYEGNEYGGNQYAGGQYGGAQYAGHEYGSHPHAGGEYAGGQYGGDEYGGHQYEGGGYGGNEYAGAQYGGDGYGDGGYAGAEHGGQYGGAGYDQQGYGAQYGGAEDYQAAGYPPQPYPDQGQQPGAAGYGGEGGGTYHAGDHQGGAHQGGATYQGGGQPDYYSEDPDYPYEFRGQGRY